MVSINMSSFNLLLPRRSQKSVSSPSPNTFQWQLPDAMKSFLPRTGLDAQRFFMILSPTTATGKTYRLIQISTPVNLRWIEPLNLGSDPDLANTNRDPDTMDR
jgi:hypothetical protein